MNESEWLAGGDPAVMLRFLLNGLSPGEVGEHAFFRPQKPSDRKSRLFAVACCNTAGMFGDWETDGYPGLTDAEWAMGWTRPGGNADRPPQAVKAALLRELVGNPFRPASLPKCGRCDGAGEAQGSDRPFQWTGRGTYPGPCPVCGRLGWDAPYRTPAVLAVAQSIYQERDFALLPVLADALEDGGHPAEERCHNCRPGAPHDQSRWSTWGCTVCGNRGRWPHPLLAHLRSPVPHVLGCWALDLVLGKE